MKEKKLKILHWGNGWIHIVSHDHKWDEIMLTPKEQRELFEYLKTNIEKHELEEQKDKEEHIKRYGY
jgi:hypothetical protein